eukprot:4004439-Prymnesium_polylepis.1
MPPFSANGKPWPLEGLGAAHAMRSARKAAARPPSRLWHGDRWSPCHNRFAARLGFSPSASIGVGAAEPVAGGQP